MSSPALLEDPPALVLEGGPRVHHLDLAEFGSEPGRGDLVTPLEGLDGKGNGLGLGGRGGNLAAGREPGVVPAVEDADIIYPRKAEHPGGPAFLTPTSAVAVDHDGLLSVYAEGADLLGEGILGEDLTPTGVPGLPLNVGEVGPLCVHRPGDVPLGVKRRSSGVDEDQFRSVLLDPGGVHEKGGLREGRLRPESGGGKAQEQGKG